MWHELKTIIGRWKRWHRTNRAVHWGLRGLALGLLSGFAAILLLLPLHNINALEYIEWVFFCAQGGWFLGFIGGFAWPLNELRTIHWFDQIFGLQERVSTAVEIQRIVTRNMSGKEILLGGWRDRQLYDTVEAAKTIKPGKLNPFQWERPVLLLVYAMGFMIMVLWVYAQPQFQTTDSERQARFYLKTEMDRIQNALNDIKQAKNLTESQKSALSQPFTDAIKRLEKANSPEQAITALNQAEQQFRSMSTPPDNKKTQTLLSMGQQMGKTNESPFGGVGNALSTGDLVTAGQTLEGMDFSKMTQGQRQAAVVEMNQVGQSLKFSNPQISTEMQAAAIALQQGNFKTAQQFLQDAGRTIEQTGSQVVEAQVAKNAAVEMGQRQDYVNQQSAQTSPGKKGTVVAIQKTPGPFNSTPGADSSGGSTVISGGGNGSTESVYSPSQTDGSSQAAGQRNGNTLQSGSGGTSQVPYVEVLPAYTDAYHKAMDNGDVPVYLQPVIRDYFSALQSH